MSPELPRRGEVDRSVKTAVRAAHRSGWLCLEWLFGVALFGASAAAAQDSGAGNLPTHIDVNELPGARENVADDPLGADEDTQQVEQAAAADAVQDEEDRRRFGPRSPGITPVSGASIKAISGVREQSHAMAIRLEAGLAIVEETMTFTSIADHPAEISVGLPLPADAAGISLRVCHAHGCRDAVRGERSDRSAYDDAVRARGPSSGAPVAFGWIEATEHGAMWTILAAPVRADAPLTIQCVWVAESQTHGGIVRFRVPSRGADTRAASVQVSVASPDSEVRDLNGESWRGPSEVDPWNAIEIAASFRSAASRHLWSHRVPCPPSDRRAARSRTSCVRLFASSAFVEGPAVDLILAIDRSRSVQGPAIGRTPFAIQAIVEALPRGSSLRAIAFSSRTESLVAQPTPPDQVALTTLAGSGEDLGASTRIEAVWNAVRDGFRPGRRTVLVLLGDGGLTAGPGADAAFSEARRRGVEVSAVNVSDRPTATVLARGVARTGGIVIEAGSVADRALQGEDRPLAERIAALFSRVIARTGTGRGGSLRAGSLRSGEAMERIAPALPRSRSGSDDSLARAAFAHVEAGQLRAHGHVFAWTAVEASVSAVACSTRGPASRPDGVSSDAAPVALVETRTCTLSVRTASLACPTPLSANALAPETIRFLVRQRIVPPARACFRADRRGRADYSVRATFYFALADREVIAAGVSGAISERLQACLLRAIDALEIPAFSGVIAVNYPLRTEREETPPIVALGADVREALDAVIGTSVRSDDVLRLAAPPHGGPHDTP